MTEISDRYDPTSVEARWYGEWERRGYFRGDPSAPGKPFCIVIPPPNVTGSLHMGHAFTFTIQDVLVRYKRMDGFNTLWQPGTDHAGIATQYVVERQLATEGKRKEDLGRDAFAARVWQWTEDAGGTIINQLKRLGASCDWSRLRFTLDPGLSVAVREVFVRLWEEKLIYQDDYIVNWCTRCQTVLSDLEVEREERDGEFVYIKYGPLTLGTVRPETKLGDTGLAVHPKDSATRSTWARRSTVPSVQGEVTVRVVADAAVDPKFGTGVIKVTPGHDPVDFEIGKRHGLPVRTVIGLDGKMTAAAGKYAGLDRFECRKRIVEDMQALGLIDRIEPYRHAVGLCYRCKSVVEPLVSKQWYVSVKPMAEAAVKAVRDRRNAHRAPGLGQDVLPLDGEHSHVVHLAPALVGPSDSRVALRQGRERARRRARISPPAPIAAALVRQDPDVLDTWFSSGLWPFSTLGWPEATPELKKLLPDLGAGHRLRHHLLLGGADGHARAQGDG